MRNPLTVLIPLTLSATLATAGWDNNAARQGYGNMNSGFGFSMGFQGRGRQYMGNRPIVLNGVHFEFDSARLTPESSVVLDDVAEKLQQTPDIKVEIDGHASAEGDDRYNLDLSTRRAEAVREYLIEAGVDADSMSANGFGETRPLVSNADENGRTVNRRVELLRL